MNGPAVRIGEGFALACGIRIDATEADILEACVNIGLAPDGGVSWLLPRLVGTGVAYEMFFTGKPLQAADAHRLGVINRLVPADRLEAEVRELASQLASQPRYAMAAAKRGIPKLLVPAASAREAAVVKAVLRKRTGKGATTSALYQGILRDLGVTDAQVERFLAEHEVEVEQAIRSHGRRGD